MKLVTFGLGHDYRLGLFTRDGMIDASASCAAGNDGDGAVMLKSLATLLNSGPVAWRKLRLLADKAEKAPDAVCRVHAPLMPPVPAPPKLICMAGNYRSHVREGGGVVADKRTTTPRLFLKPPATTLSAPGEPIVIPRSAGWMDWEGELAVVIGRRAKHLRLEEALDVVAGYTILNDISERKLPVGGNRVSRDGDRWFDWLLGKWMDGSAPMGPCMVTPDEIPDPQDLVIEVRVNGVLKQQASTAEMIYSCAEIIAWTSQYMTLEPGDIVSTGTPAGVGIARGERLRAGDCVSVTIEPIGTLDNPVVDEIDD